MSVGTSELGSTLRAWRARPSLVRPTSESGSARRRTPGLRREELAELAGISVDYVTRLEQGRASGVSAEVLAGLADALRLNDAERDHLHRLARQGPPVRGDIPDDLTHGLRRVLDRLGVAVAAAVFAADWRIIWWNDLWSALLGDPAEHAPELRNFALDTFGVNPSPCLVQWPVVSDGIDAKRAAVVSDLRQATGRFPASERLRTLVAVLDAGSAEFRELWAAGAVGAHTEDHKVVHHPTAGAIELDCDVVTEGDDFRKIVLLSAAAESNDARRLQVLRSQ